jgi:hypothetical protein
MASLCSHLLDLPDELLLRIAAQLSIGPDAAVLSSSLPLVCVAFRGICASRAIAAIRLISRVRTVVSETPEGTVLDETAAGHVWVTAADVHAFILGGDSSVAGDSRARRAAALVSAEHGAAECLQALLHRCSLGVASCPPPPPCAEQLFAASEACRFFSQMAVPPPAPPSPSRPVPRPGSTRASAPGRPRDAAVRNAESAAFAREMAKHQLVAAEMERQTIRQLGAHCRRMWKQMPLSERLAWARQAEEVRGRWERHRQAARAAAHVATKLNAVLSAALAEV